MATITATEIVSVTTLTAGDARAKVRMTDGSVANVRVVAVDKHKRTTNAFAWHAYNTRMHGHGETRKAALLALSRNA